MESLQKYYTIGIDVGGTNTDSVLLEYPGQKVIKTCKTSTTKDIQSGVINSIKALLVNSE